MNIKTFFLTVLSTIYLVFSYVVYVWFAFLTFLGLLIPYDVVLLEERPPVGSLSLSINNYFEKSGDLWFMAVIIFSLIILIVTIFRGKKLPANVILFYFAILNCFFGACLILFTLLGSLLKTADFNWVAIFGAFVSLLLVWYLQASLYFVKFFLNKKTSENSL